MWFHPVSFFSWKTPGVSMEFKLDPQIDMEPYVKTRKAWTKEEDEVLIQSIQTYGVGHWAAVAQALREQTGIQRSTKQCRNRWMNTLDPNVNKQEWTPEEEQMIYDLQKQVGNKWAEIAKHLSGRFDCVLSIIIELIILLKIIGTPQCEKSFENSINLLVMSLIRSQR